MLNFGNDIAGVRWLRILKPVRYVFFRILMWKLRGSRKSTPVLVASLLTSLLLFLNVVLAIILVDVGIGRTALPRIDRSVESCVAAAAIVAAMSWLIYSIWVANGNFDKLRGEFAHGRFPPPARTFLFRSYVAFTILAPVLVIVAVSGV